MKKENIAENKKLIERFAAEKGISRKELAMIAASIINSFNCRKRRKILAIFKDLRSLSYNTSKVTL